jgi:hypothetical protein
MESSTHYISSLFDRLDLASDLITRADGAKSITSTG